MSCFKNYKTMKLLFVNDIPFNPIAGGLERVTDVLTKELIKRGYTVYYLCMKIGPRRQYLLDYDFPARLYQLPVDGLFENEENVAFFKNLQSELHIDVVINQRGLGGLFNSILSLTTTKLISVIHSIPEADVIIFINKLVELTVPPFVAFKKFVKKTLPIINYYWKVKAIADDKKKYKELGHYSDAIVTLSNNDIKSLERFIEKAPCKARICSIPNPNTFDIIEEKPLCKEKMLLYVGRLTKSEKAPMRLLMIWKNLYKRFTDWRLVLVGDGNEKDNMLAYIKENNLSNVFFEGRQSDVAEYYKKASFVCLTSNFEGWGMALTEGMQYGCIPFTFNNYGAAYEIIDDGVNGCLIPAFDLKKYASRLSELMSDDERRSKMSVAAIEKVKMFSAEKIVDKWEWLLNSL